jgi:rod shape-determining protein MreD
MRRVVPARRAAAVKVVGPVQWILLPALAVLAVTLLLATPIKVFGLTLPEPVAPLVLAFAWPLIRPSVLAPLALLVVGLVVDLFWGNRLGLWPLGLLAAYGVVLISRSYISGQDTRLLFAWYSGVSALAFFIVYLVTAMTAGQPPSLIALFFQYLPTILIFPAANWLIDRFDDGDLKFR